MEKILWRLEIKEKRKQMKEFIEKELKKGNLVFLIRGNVYGNIAFESAEDLYKCDTLTDLDTFVIGYGRRAPSTGLLKYVEMCWEYSSDRINQNYNVTMILTTDSYRIPCMGIARHGEWYDVYSDKTEEMIIEQTKRLGYKWE